MKRLIIVLILVIQTIIHVNGQGIRIDSSGVAINTDDSPPHQSAILDIKSTNKGILIPRNSYSSIASPAKGLMVYDTVAYAFWVYNGSSWEKIFADDMGTHIATQNISVGDYWISYSGGNSGIKINSSGNVGVGVSSPTQKLDVGGSIKVAGNVLMNGYWLSNDGDSEGLFLTTGGNVGIGNNSTCSSPASLLSVGANGSSSYTSYIYSSLTSDGSTGLRIEKSTPSSSSSTGYSLYSYIPCGTGYAIGIKGLSYNGTASSNGRSFGVYGEAGNATSGWNYGVYGKVAGTNYATAVYATTVTSEYLGENLGATWAGYFKGNIYINGRVGIKQKTISYGIDMQTDSIRVSKLVLSSDRRFKKNIKNINDEKINILDSLVAVTYDYDFDILKTFNDSVTTDSTVSRIDYYNVQNGNAKGIGFIAQSVQQFYPELVSADSRGLLSVDYISFIPLIIESLKKQNEILEEQLMTIERIELEIENLKESNSNE